MRKLFKTDALPCLNFRYQQCFKFNPPFFAIDRCPHDFGIDVEVKYLVDHLVDFSFITHVLTGMFASVLKRKGYRFQKIPSPLHIIFRSLSPRVKVLQLYLSDSKRTRELLINDQAGNPSTARSTVDLA